MLFERGVYKKILLEGSLTFNRGVGNVSEKERRLWQDSNEKKRESYDPHRN